MFTHTAELFAGLGITDPDSMDLWTALISGLTAQQLSNDPGGTRWERLISRSVDMYQTPDSAQASRDDSLAEQIYR